MSWLYSQWAPLFAVICDANHPRKAERPKKGCFDQDIKIFTKVELIVSKNCHIVGPACLMICCILRDVHLQNSSFLRGLSTEFIFFFNFYDIATYPMKLGIQIKNFPFFKLISEISHSLMYILTLHVLGRLKYYLASSEILGKLVRLSYVNIWRDTS